MTDANLDYDVAIVGYGPVGQSLATMLGQRGWSVLVLDQQPGLYPLPRACHFDHEAMRILQSMGIASEINGALAPAREYLLLRADLSVLSDLPRGWETPSGWEASYHFYQPDIENIFDQTAKATPGVTVRQSTAVLSVEDRGDHVVLTTSTSPDETTARFVIGADGANSLVRQQSGIERDDLGFEATWVVVDVLVNEGHEVPKVPDTGQVLDPVQPTHIAWLGGNHLRWEFMIVDDSDPADAATPEHVWPKLRRWVGPETATIVRSTAYTFRSLIAETFRKGNVLLAGDAAHLMPPFMGQGLVSGLRDAASLTWMLDLVLRGVAPADFLDEYTASRLSHVTKYVAESVRVGQLVCETDPVRAVERDRMLTAQTESSPPFQPPVGSGYIPGVLAGQLSVQPWVQGVDGPALLDDVLGSGLTVLTSDANDIARSSDETRARLERIGVRPVVLGDGLATGEAGACLAFAEHGTRFADWIRAAGATWCIVRPDGYVYAAGAGADQLDAAVGELFEYVSCVRTDAEAVAETVSI